MACEDVHAALSMFQTCAETPNGSRVMTHCLYPSFEPVDVYAFRLGDGFRIHDFGGARREAWLHGVDDGQMTRILNLEAARHQVEVQEGRIFASVPSQEWLFAGITAVANASANAARIAVDDYQPAKKSSEEDLRHRIESILFENLPASIIRKGYNFRGESGKDHKFDFALKGRGNNTVLISAVSSHHASIASKYMAFADTKIKGYESVGRFAVFDGTLDGLDAALLQQVADLVPVRSLVAGAQRAIMTFELRDVGLP